MDLETLRSHARAALADLGMTVTGQDDLIGAEKEEIGARWMLGARSTRRKLSLRLDEATRTAIFREVVIDRGWGLPPPRLWAGAFAIKGRALSGRRVERSGWGGGEVDYAAPRERLRQLVEAAGWSFRIELRMP